MGVDLYAVDASPPCRAVYMVAKAIGLDVNIKTVDTMNGEQKKPAYLKINPLGKVPALDDNGVIVTDSHAIIGYLMNKYAPTSRLYPKDPAARGLVDARLYYDFGLFDAWKATMTQTPASQEAFHDTLKALETYLSGSSYVAGDHLTIADLALLASVASVEAMEHDMTPYPKIKAWLAKLKADLPYFEACNAKGLAILVAMIKKRMADMANK